MANHWRDPPPVGGAGAKGDTGPSGKPATINLQTDSYTLDIGDFDDANPDVWVHMNKSTANALTVPPNASVAFPIGASIRCRQMGAGATTITAGAGVTVNVDASLTLVANGQYAEFTLSKVATNTWIAAGNLVPAA